MSEKKGILIVCIGYGQEIMSGAMNSYSTHFYTILWLMLIIFTTTGFNSVQGYVMEGDECLFRVDLIVKFTTFDTSDYPKLLDSASGPIALHGLGPTYGANKGKITFYVNTPIGSNNIVNDLMTSHLHLTLGTVLLQRNDPERSI